MHQLIHRSVNDHGTLADCLGECILEDHAASDSLLLVLVYYFERHMDRPKHDSEDPETGWSLWAMNMAQDALSRIAHFSEKEILTRLKDKTS